MLRRAAQYSGEGWLDAQWGRLIVWPPRLPSPLLSFIEISMKCLTCGHQNRRGAKFCEACGRPHARRCPNCGNSASATAKSCAECGQPLELALGLRVKGRVDTPQSLTPKHLVERVLIWKNAMKGERKQVTVLFAEVNGSMELLADHDPEETMKLLDPILAHMMAAVHQYERPVNQVMGGGVSAWPIKASDGTRAALGVRQTQWRSLWPPPRSQHRGPVGCDQQRR